MLGKTRQTADRTADEMVAEAIRLRPDLLERQAEAEQRTYPPERTHRDFLDAGFYRMLVPRCFGGYELDILGFFRVVLELARGCPSSAWFLCLSAGHALQVGSLFEEEAQIEIFGDGDFRCPAVAAPAGTAKPKDGGWEISGTFAYCSGAPYATHYMGQTFAPPAAPGGQPGGTMLFVAPRSQWKMLDDWGTTLGLKGSGSQSIRLEQAQIPSNFVLQDVLLIDIDVSGGTPGLRLHGNPMYAGRTLSFFQGELAAIVVGAVKGAVDEYEVWIKQRNTQAPPIVPRYMDPDYQRWFGTAIGRIAAAEAAVLHVGQQYMELCHRAVTADTPFSRSDDLRLNIVAREAIALAWDAMQGILFRTAGTSAAQNGQRMERIFRDVAMVWGHYANVVGDWAARELARERLGIKADL